MTVLVVAAHPDDEVLGCGATIARRAAEGEAVHIVILGEGATSRTGLGDERADPVAVGRLAQQSQRACAILGASGTRNLGFPDNRFDAVDLLDLVQAIEAVMGDVHPDSVLTHHGGDVNIDHRRTFEAVLAATRPVPGAHVADVWCFEIASSSEWAFGTQAPFRPQVLVDVSATLDRKVQAMEAYEDEARPFPHPRSAEGLRALATVRGVSAGVAAAEAFEVVRMLR